MTADTPQTTTYTIATVQDFLAVPPSRRADCLREFAVWADMMDDIPALMTYGIKVVMPAAFVWIDDGLHTMTVGIQAGDTNIPVAHGVMKGFGHD